MSSEIKYCQHSEVTMQIKHDLLLGFIDAFNYNGEYETSGVIPVQMETTWPGED